MYYLLTNACDKSAFKVIFIHGPHNFISLSLSSYIFYLEQAENLVEVFLNI